jgi:hypothetical protein
VEGEGEEEDEEEGSDDDEEEEEPAFDPRRAHETFIMRALQGLTAAEVRFGCCDQCKCKVGVTDRSIDRSIDR